MAAASCSRPSEKQPDFSGNSNNAAAEQPHQILQHLLAGLNREHAPELCENLEGLYLFSMRHIVNANIHQKPENLAEVLTILTPLREAWTTVVRGGSGITTKNEDVVILR